MTPQKICIAKSLIHLSICIYAPSSFIWPRFISLIVIDIFILYYFVNNNVGSKTMSNFRVVFTMLALWSAGAAIVAVLLIGQTQNTQGMWTMANLKRKEFFGFAVPNLDIFVCFAIQIMFFIYSNIVLPGQK